MPGDGSVEQQYAALVAGPAVIDRSYRALIEVTGKDRVAWVHNLTTNQVKTLGRDEGNYAFVLNVQGRILFDLTVVVRAESIWLDVDRRFLETALKHFNKYIIMEDVRLADRSPDYARLALAGEKAKNLLANLGATQAGTMASYSMSCFPHAGVNVDLIRNDSCGVFAADLFAPTSIAGQLKSSLTAAGAIPVGEEAVQMRRIEAGIPWAGAEITEEYLPAETRQLERAVSFQKGCYLGQEIVERMRARKVVAKLLCGLRVAGERVPEAGAELTTAEGAVVGKLTSACRSVALRETIALGYVKSAVATAGTSIQVRCGSQSTEAVVANLPFVSS